MGARRAAVIAVAAVAALTACSTSTSVTVAQPRVSTSNSSATSGPATTGVTTAPPSSGAPSTSSSTPGATTTTTTITTTTTGAGSSPTTTVATADRRLLEGVVVQQADTPVGYPVGVIQGGDQVTGEATLDLCLATFPSEDLRTARHQVAVDDRNGQGVLSTEAVLYQSASATSQAFSELRDAAAHCPPTAVPTPAPGGSAIKTVFNPAPDANWPAVSGVDRLAFDMTLSDDKGHQAREVAVYLRRGRLLLGVYFPQADLPTQPLIAGQSSIEGIVGVFAARVAAVPDGAVS